MIFLDYAYELVNPILCLSRKFYLSFIFQYVLHVFMLLFMGHASFHVHLYTTRGFSFFMYLHVYVYRHTAAQGFIFDFTFFLYDIELFLVSFLDDFLDVFFTELSITAIDI